MGHEIVFFGLLRPARSRQDESREVREVGPKRTSDVGRLRGAMGACRLVDWADFSVVEHRCM
jgi:hypothetical protein